MPDKSLPFTNHPLPVSGEVYQRALAIRLVDKPPPCPRRWSFGLRTLLLAITAVAVLLAAGSLSWKWLAQWFAPKPAPSYYQFNPPADPYY